ncbi:MULTISPECIES: hypothetical protein [Paenibacillus]|uniref:Uncharacterized protein n=1 Tax=Paenibacillus xylanilyticus TaxID=248903 RepID=A0A7Y6C352_9BACL|nr:MULTISPECIES: hypothetical protein [Paenibacillus]NUU79752.1 hypothetical protein [Paenibacillus xylanilyticus]SFS99849.1 hypothetical protein SAMN04488601_1172 [Paenibacillus sp. 453mf]
MASPKLNLALNKNAEEIIALAAKKMGTSKRNAISLALVDILKNSYDKRFIDLLANETTLSVATASTISEQMHTMLEGIERHGYSRRVFFGLLISDYFLNNQNKFIDQDDSDDIDVGKGNLEITIDQAKKDVIMTYCQKNSMTVSSLFSHYIMNEDINIDSFEISNKAHLNLIFSNSVKKVLENKAKSTNRTYRFYLNLVAEQIIRNIST